MMTVFLAGVLVGALLTMLFLHWFEHRPAYTPETPEEEAARRRNIARTQRLDPGHSLMCDCDACLRAFGG